MYIQGVDVIYREECEEFEKRQSILTQIAVLSIRIHFSTDKVEILIVKEKIKELEIVLDTVN